MTFSYGQKLTTLESELYVMMLCKWKFLKRQKKFFLKAILQEPLGHSFTREESSTLVSNNSDNEDCWCYCRMSQSEDNLLSYDNATCKIKWFHLKCVFIKKIPKGKW